MMGRTTVTKRALLCFDFGTSSIKAGLIDSDGILREWHHEDLLALSGADLERWNPDLWLVGLRNVASQFFRSARKGRSVGGRAGHILQSNCELSGVVFSGNGPTIVGVDSGGNAVDAAVLWMNRREIARPGSSSFFLPKIAWIREHRPELYERAAHYFSFPEFLSFRAGGERVTITPTDSFARYIWTQEEIREYGVDPAKIPPFVRVGERIGSVTLSGAGSTGLPEGTPLFSGGSDFLMSLLGTGVVKPGRTCDRAGTSEGINHCVGHPVSNPRIRCLPHVIDGLFNAAGILASTGRIFEWFRGISGQGSKGYAEMLQEIIDVGHEASIPFFFPSLHRGETWEFSGAIFSNLEPHHGVAEMGRAVVESIGFGVRDLIETLERNSCPIDEVRACGGQARNAVWNQMKSDMTGKPIAVPSIVDAELLGDACAGFVALGEQTSLAEAAEALVHIERVYEPNRGENRKYSDEYSGYEERCRRILDAAHAVERSNGAAAVRGESGSASKE